MPDRENNSAVEINAEASNYEIDKIQGLEHLYLFPIDTDVKQVKPVDKLVIEKDEESNVQEITALQPPPSEVLTLKAGVVLNENGNVVNGPDPLYNRMTLSQYQTTLGTSTIQRKKYHEQRLKNRNK